MSEWRVIAGDVRDGLSSLAAGSVRTCVTSPPYWGLRDYGVTGQLGLERTPDAYCAALVGIFAEVRRVLTDDGTVWLNLGDSYNTTPAGSQGRSTLGEWRYAPETSAIRDAARHTNRHSKPLLPELKPKDLCGIPWLVAFALRADGWYLRSDIIWSKPNPMPESVTDRPTKAHEYLFLLSKRERYFYDAAAISEVSLWVPGGFAGNPARAFAMGRNPSGNEVPGATPSGGDTRNKRSVWTVATQPYPDAHFATFPEALIEPCILAGSAVGDTVLDPFTGSGTTGVVSVRHQRNFVGCELNPAYVQLARTRIGNVAPLLAQEIA